MSSCGNYFVSYFLNRLFRFGDTGTDKTFYDKPPHVTKPCSKYSFYCDFRRLYCSRSFPVGFRAGHFGHKTLRHHKIGLMSHNRIVRVEECPGFSSITALGLTMQRGFCRTLPVDFMLHASAHHFLLSPTIELHYLSDFLKNFTLLNYADCACGPSDRNPQLEVILLNFEL